MSIKQNYVRNNLPPDHPLQKKLIRKRKKRRTNAEAITETLKKKVDSTKPAIDHAVEKILILDSTKEPYQNAINVLDTLTLNQLDEVNRQINSVAEAYDNRIISVERPNNCRSDLFWRVTGINEPFEGASNRGGAATTSFNLTCFALSAVSIGQTTAYGPANAVGTSSTDSITTSDVGIGTPITAFGAAAIGAGTTIGIGIGASVLAFTIGAGVAAGTTIGVGTDIDFITTTLDDPEKTIPGGGGIKDGDEIQFSDYYGVGGPGIHTMVIDKVGIATVVATANAITDFADGKKVQDTVGCATVFFDTTRIPGIGTFSIQNPPTIFLETPTGLVTVGTAGTVHADRIVLTNTYIGPTASNKQEVKDARANSVGIGSILQIHSNAIVSLTSPIQVDIPYDNTGGADVWESPGLGVTFFHFFTEEQLQTDLEVIEPLSDPTIIGIVTTPGLDNRSGLLGINAYHGLKMYSEPYFEDIADTYVAGAIGTCKAGTKFLNFYQKKKENPIGEIIFEVGQLVSAPAGVFPTTVGERSTNKIVGIDTALVDFRNIGFDPDATDGESPGFDNDGNPLPADNLTLVFKFELEDNISVDVNAPNTSGNKPEFVVFDVLRNPEEFADLLNDFSLPRDTPALTPQTIKMMTTNTIGAGSSVEVVNNSDPNVTKTWNQFLDGLPDPEDFNKTVKEPRVGPGGIWFREGYTRRPVIPDNTNVDGSFESSGRNAVEGDVILRILPNRFPLLYEDIPQGTSECVAQEAALTDAINLLNTLEAQLTSDNSLISRRVRVANQLREQLAQINQRIFSYRLQNGGVNTDNKAINDFEKILKDKEFIALINQTPLSDVYHEKVFGGAPDTEYEELDPETGLPVDDDPNPFI